MRTLEQTLQRACQLSKEKRSARYVIEDACDDPGNPFGKYSIVRESALDSYIGDYMHAEFIDGHRTDAEPGGIS